eukprot:scaffold161656_cov77-Attheya_sp.AAC.1
MRMCYYSAQGRHPGTSNTSWGEIGATEPNVVTRYYLLCQQTSILYCMGHRMKLVGRVHRGDSQDLATQAEPFQMPQNQMWLQDTTYYGSKHL